MALPVVGVDPFKFSGETEITGDTWTNIEGCEYEVPENTTVLAIGKAVVHDPTDISSETAIYERRFKFHRLTGNMVNQGNNNGTTDEDTTSTANLNFRIRQSGTSIVCQGRSVAGKTMKWVGKLEVITVT